MRKIVAIEGIDGAGKTTLAYNISALLSRRQIHHVLMQGLSFFEYEAVGNVYRTYRSARRSIPLGPNALSLWFAADIAVRWEHFGQPVYESDGIVVADRYYYSSLVRDGIRGVEARRLKAIYEFLPQPDLLVYVQISPEVAYQRVIERMGGVGYYESGLDFRPSADPRTAFVSYQTQCQRHYEEVLTTVDCPVMRLSEIANPVEAANTVIDQLF